MARDRGNKPDRAPGDRAATAPARTGDRRRVEQEARTAEKWGVHLFTKFNNDWTMNLVSMVAYNVLTSFFPLILALVTILGLVSGTPARTATLVRQINQLLPAQVAKDLDLRSLLDQVHSHSVLLTAISIVTLLWGGSNLFGAIENAFAVVYRVKTRDIVRQKLMALVMIVLFVVLLPLSFVSTVLVGSATTTLGRIMPHALHGVFAAALGLFAGLAALFVLFLAMYIVVPNMAVAWRYAWRGALVAAGALWLVNTLFPFYTAHFVGTRQYGAAALGTAIISITWFWLFSLLLLLGAQVNALTMGIRAWPHDLSRVLMDYSTILQHGVSTAAPPGESGLDPKVPGLPFSGVARDSQRVAGEQTDRRHDP